MKVQVKVINKSRWPLPQYETSGASGMDVRANFEEEGWKQILYPGETITIATGLFVEIPEGYEIQVRPRSGLSLKTKMRVSNSPGTIDSCYRGELKIIVDNISNYKHIIIEDGMRVAQIVLQEVPKIEWVEVNTLSDTDRGIGGFGSTGTK